MKILLIISFIILSLPVRGSFIDDFTSPLFTKAGYVFYPGVVVSFALYQYENKEIARKVRINSLNNTERTKEVYEVGELIGLGFLNGVYTLGNLFAGETSNASHMFRASFNTFLLTWGLKAGVKEERPNKKDDFSFPSGHTSFAFAFSTVVLIRHEWYWGILATGVATFIGYSRLVNDQHWFHDVFAGAVIGTSYAIGTYLTSKGSNFAFSILPTQEGLGAQTTLAYRF